MKENQIFLNYLHLSKILQHNYDHKIPGIKNYYFVFFLIPCLFENSVV